MEVTACNEGHAETNTSKLRLQLHTITVATQEQRLEDTMQINVSVRSWHHGERTVRLRVPNQNHSQKHSLSC